MLHLLTWMAVLSDDVRGRFADLARERKDRGATTLEYVVIAAAVFVAAMGLVAVILNVIEREQRRIQ